MTPSWILAVLLPIPGCAQQSPAPVTTLKEAFAAALANSETIAVSARSVDEAQALYRRALGSSFPGLSFRATTDWDDPAGPPRASPPAHNGSLRLSQTGLSGYRQLAAVKAGRSTVGQRTFERLRAEQLLLGDVAGAFFGLLQARQNVSSTRRLADLAEKRLAHLKERVRVGRTREADAIGQEVQVSSLRSQLEESSRQVLARQDLLAYLVKAPVGEPADAVEAPKPAERPLESYLAAVDARPDVRAVKESRDTAEGLAGVARADRLPDLGLSANYYAYRPASLRSERWDASVELGVPLWYWGARAASVDAASAVLGRRELELQAARRAAELDVKDAHRDYASARRQLDILSRAVELARRDYELQVNDERRGLVTSLEVLESLNRLNNAELAFNSARLQERLTAVNLGVASGAAFEDMELLR